MNARWWVNLFVWVLPEWAHTIVSVFTRRRLVRFVTLWNGKVDFRWMWGPN